ncbi:MAG TPA: RNA pyrophosphohydrolase [Gammaproteobacteria bacterium]|nr:RNA pyrophosphohydrolase [Gammaproteobacteria bacterium]
MIDDEGFRQGIGIILVNARRQLFLAKRIGKPAWQFPQGGMKETETPEEAMYRELKEEIGLLPESVKILATTKRWLRYRLPKSLVRHHSHPLCIGQKQKWFLLRMTGQDDEINLIDTESPEFDSWAWVSYWYPLTQVVSFKRRVYSMAMKEFARIVLSRRFFEKE